MKLFSNRPLTVLFLLFLCSISVCAQTSAFTYQGRLTDGGAAANGTYEMQFKLFDAASAGTQIGATVTNNSVTVANGIFTVTLNFTAAPFSAADRWLEIGVRKSADPPGFTILAPRQPITSSPYSIRTLSAAAADSLSAACVGCVTDARINTVSGAKITGTVANATNAVNATNATNATNAATATTAGNVTGTVGVGNGGTGATTATNARVNLGLGTLAVLSPTGTANTATFLRGDGSWQTPPPVNAPGFVFNPTTQTNHFTINPANNFSVYQVNRCGGGATNVTLPTAAAAGAGKVLYIVSVTPDPCTTPNFLLHLVLQPGDWIEYTGNFTIADRLQYMLVSNGTNGWLAVVK
ncbi:MAG TPA: hypothetical protein VIL74_00620 [Pyrinomonadaceae bacterium]|jgi:hypothetical protein